jgi:hypothetical protein
LIILIILGKEYKLCSSSLHNGMGCWF